MSETLIAALIGFLGSIIGSILGAIIGREQIKGTAGIMMGVFAGLIVGFTISLFFITRILNPTIVEPLPNTPTQTTDVSSTPSQSNIKTTDRILISSDLNNNVTDLYSVNSDGTEITRLTESESCCFPASFTPNGETIIFGYHGDIWKMNADGEEKINLTNTSEDELMPTILPDGSKITYCIGNTVDAVIYSINLDGSDRSELFRISNCPSTPLNPALNWSPNGERLAFLQDASYSYVNVAPNSTYIVSVIGPGSDIQEISTMGAIDPISGAIWSPNGEQIAFSTYSSNMAEVWTIGADGDFPKRIFGSIGTSRISLIDWHDNKILIAAWDERGNLAPYFIADDGTGNLTKVILRGAHNQPMDWLP